MRLGSASGTGTWSRIGWCGTTRCTGSMALRKEEFSGAFDAWSRCLVPEDVARATADVEAALRGDREYRSDFRVRRADGAIRTIRGVGQTIRGADGRPVRMVGVNRDVTDLISAEREREQLVHELRTAPGAPRSARRQPHDRAARRQGGRGERQPGEERLPGQHVPRDPHADERDPRLRPAARTRPGPGRRSEAEDRHHPLQRQSSADVDQRHSGDVEDRGGPRDARGRTIRLARAAARRAAGCSAS